MTAIYYDPLFLEHDTGKYHPERPERLRAIHNAISLDAKLAPMLRPVAAPAEEQALARVHAPAYIADIRGKVDSAPLYLDADTVMSPRSYEAARLASGAAIEAVDAVMAGQASNAFCAVRPPGHHAEPDRAMGFCLFNSIAIAARHLIDQHGLERVLIIDWDVHHGNGTQAAFYQERRVYFLSFHQWPLYPGTGHPEERGSGDGSGQNLNVIFSPHTPAKDYLTKFDETIDHVFASFSPQFVLISAGFDAHEQDPLAQLELTEKSFEQMSRQVLMRAAETASGRVVSLLEGGYHLDALVRSVMAHLHVMSEFS